MTATTGANARNSDVDAVRAEVQATRAELGETVGALAEKADVKKRASDSMHEHPTVWSAAGGGLLAVTGAVIGVLTWRRRRGRPISRAQRAWRSVTSRVHK
jgi:hypothetical protein